MVATAKQSASGHHPRCRNSLDGDARFHAKSIVETRPVLPRGGDINDDRNALLLHPERRDLRERFARDHFPSSSPAASSSASTSSAPGGSSQRSASVRFATAEK